MPLPPSPSPPRAAARRLPLQTMPLPRPRRLPRISIAPAQAPSTSRSSGGSNVATVAPAPSTSRSSAGPNVDSTQPSTSTGRTGACRRPPTAASGVDVARQRLRELVLDHFLQVFVFAGARSRGVHCGGVGCDVHPEGRAQGYALARRPSSRRDAP
ncbi:early nodulin-20-like [Homalodisca vitripennis]|uniref:early nodulin-20-like n=1 Tax=Homalodisca vitripennis TaxID=197043 RepID=UPI001EEC66F7|nr:early nodulin-20-like [Homalodisca vitripennis]